MNFKIKNKKNYGGENQNLSIDSSSHIEIGPETKEMKHVYIFSPLHWKADTGVFKINLSFM